MDKNELPRLLLRPGEAAEVLGIGRSRMYEIIAAGLIPCVRIGKTVRVPAEALRQWISEQLSEQRK